MEMCPELSRAYLTFLEWPQPDLYPRPYQGRICDIRERLQQEEKSPRLLQKSDEDQCLQFRELSLGGTCFMTKTVQTDRQLIAHFGETWTTGIAKEARTVATKRDPICRFIYLSGPSSRKPLWATHRSFTRIMTYHQVMPEFLDYAMLLGKQDRSQMADPILSGFQENTTLLESSQTLQSPTLGRSGTHIEMCYTLRGVAFKSRDSSWSIQPAAIYHRYDHGLGTVLWLVVNGQQQIFNRFERHTGDESRPSDMDYRNPQASFRTTLGIHCLYAQWAANEWRTYVKALENSANRTTGGLVHEHRERSPQRSRIPHGLSELADIQYNEERCRKAIIAIRGNIDVFKALVEHYLNFLDDQTFTLREACRVDILDFNRELSRISGSLKSDLDRALYVEGILSSRKQLVSHYIQSQTTERMESLTLSTRNISVESQHEASTVRIFTVVTLFFLPVTFVSTLFSANLFSIPAAGDQGLTPLQTWAVVSAVLTVITLGIARGYYLRSFDALEVKRGTDTFYALKDGQYDEFVEDESSSMQQLDLFGRVLRFVAPYLLEWRNRRRRSRHTTRDQTAQQDPENGSKPGPVEANVRKKRFRTPFPMPKMPYAMPPRQLNG